MISACLKPQGTWHDLYTVVSVYEDVHAKKHVSNSAFEKTHTEKSLTRTCGPKPPDFYGNFIILLSKWCFNHFQILRELLLWFLALSRRTFSMCRFNFPQLFWVDAKWYAHSPLFFPTTSHHYPLVIQKFATLKPWPIEIVDLPSYKMVIFHSFLYVCQAGYHQILPSIATEWYHGSEHPWIAGMYPRDVATFL